MIFTINKNIKFSNYYKKLNFFSLIFIILSLIILFTKGLNLGVDFKGGTLIEVRTENTTSNIRDIRNIRDIYDIRDIYIDPTTGHFLKIISRQLFHKYNEKS